MKTICYLAIIMQAVFYLLLVETPMAEIIGQIAIFNTLFILAAYYYIDHLERENLELQDSHRFVRRGMEEAAREAKAILQQRSKE